MKFIPACRKQTKKDALNQDSNVSCIKYPDSDAKYAPNYLNLSSSSINRNHLTSLHVSFPLCLVSMSISNLYPGCENVSVRSRSMMFEPSLTKGVLEVFSPVHNALSTADEQATKAIDIQHANIHSENPASIDILFIHFGF